MQIFFFTFVFFASLSELIGTLPSIILPTKQLLDRCFRDLINDHEVGYVLFGTKPICYFQFSHANSTSDIGADSHRFENRIKEGLRVWATLSPSIKREFRIRFIADAPGPNTQCMEVLVINHDAVRKVVNENLSLFQYVLGPNVCPEIILEALSSSKHSLYHHLNHDNALVGILLGYGRDNALAVAREEAIHAAFLNAPQPPFAQAAYPPALVGYRDAIFSMPLFYREANRQRYVPNVSLGHVSLEEEYKTLQGTSQISSQRLSTYRPWFIFGVRTKNQEDAKAKLLALEEEQYQLIRLLESENLLSQILDKFGLDADSLPQNVDLTPLTALSCEELSSFVAEEMLLYLKGIGIPYRESLLDGISRAADISSNPKALSKRGWELREQYYNNMTRQPIIAELKKTQKFFQTLSTAKNMVSVVPDKVYYRILKEGEGAIVTSEVTAVTAACTIAPGIDYGEETFKTDAVVLALPCPMNLQTVIPGFAFGIQGMRVGEVRELFIHPDYAYGICTTLPQGSWWRAKVQLTDIDQTPSIIPPFQPDTLVTELEFLQKYKEKSAAPTSSVNLTEEAIETAQQPEEELLLIIGYELFSHYRYHNGLLSQAAIIASLKQLASGKEIKSSLSSEDKEIALNQLHLILFQNRLQCEREAAAALFANLKNSNSVQELVPGLLSYERVHPGDSPEVIVKEAATIKLRFKDRFDNTLEEFLEPTFLELDRTMTALRMGLTGLSQGEHGVLYIHPDLTYYGSCNPLLKEKLLIVEIEVSGV